MVSGHGPGWVGEGVCVGGGGRRAGVVPLCVRLCVFRCTSRPPTPTLLPHPTPPHPPFPPFSCPRHLPGPTGPPPPPPAPPSHSPPPPSPLQAIYCVMEVMEAALSSGRVSDVEWWAGQGKGGGEGGWWEVGRGNILVACCVCKWMGGVHACMARTMPPSFLPPFPPCGRREGAMSTLAVAVEGGEGGEWAVHPLEQVRDE